MGRQGQRGERHGYIEGQWGLENLGLLNPR